MSMAKPATVLKMAGTSLAFAGALYAVGVDDKDEFSDAFRASLEVAAFGALLWLLMGAGANK